MATKTKPAATPATANPPIDLLDLDDKLEDRLRHYTSTYNGAYGKQLDVVRGLEAQLKEERAKLETMAAPLRQIEKALDPARLAALAEVEVFDAPLKTMTARLHTTKSESRHDKKKNRWLTEKKPTGAIGWSELQARGASDQQIAKNLRTLDLSTYSPSVGNGDYTLTLKELVLYKGSQYSGRKILSGAKLIAAVRRVWGVPQPVKGAAAPAAKKPPAKKKRTTKKPAAKKTTPASRALRPASRGRRGASRRATPAAKAADKPAGKKPLSGGAKRKLRKEREDALAAELRFMGQMVHVDGKGRPIMSKAQRQAAEVALGAKASAARDEALAKPQPEATLTNGSALGSATPAAVSRIEQVAIAHGHADKLKGRNGAVDHDEVPAAIASKGRRRRASPFASVNGG